VGVSFGELDGFTSSCAETAAGESLARHSMLMTTRLWACGTIMHVSILISADENRSCSRV
jgi:hypothetical protein